MDRFLSWLDTSDVFTVMLHAWPWIAVTAVMACVAVAGIANIARRYGQTHERLAIGTQFD